MNERAVPRAGKLTVILDGTAAVGFDDMLESDAAAIAGHFVGRKRDPFWVIHDGKRLMLFPESPPKGILWEPK